MSIIALRGVFGYSDPPVGEGGCFKGDIELHTQGARIARSVQPKK